MASVVDPSAADVIVEEAGDDPDQWPELRDSHRKGKQDKVQWGEGVRSEEEVYLAKLGEFVGTDKGAFANIDDFQRASWPK